MKSYSKSVNAFRGLDGRETNPRNKNKDNVIYRPSTGDQTDGI